MEQFSSSIGAGIVSGLLASLLVIFFRSWWLKIIIPWYEDRLYHDAKIEGDWKAFAVVEGLGEEEFIWQIKRVGHSVSGTCVGIKGPDENVIYDLNGTFKNLMLIATYHARDRTSLDCGSLSVMLVNNGQTLKGMLTYYRYDNHDIKSTELLCERLLPNKRLQLTAR